SARGTKDIDDILTADARQGSATLAPAKDTSTPVRATDPATPPVDTTTQLDVVPADTTASPVTAGSHSDRLLVLKQNRWVDGSLPEDWPEDARKWVVTRQNMDPAPLLITLMPASDGE